eukprot:2403591-Prymnesium_polylepis.2
MCDALGTVLVLLDEAVEEAKTVAAPSCSGRLPIATVVALFIVGCGQCGLSPHEASASQLRRLRRQVDYGLALLHLILEQVVHALGIVRNGTGDPL